MSSTEGGTRRAVLEAARQLVTEHGRRAVSMAEIASAAGVSRQAVYLHFQTRTELLVALVRHVDEVHGFHVMLRKCEREADGRAALFAFVAAWAGYVARITAVARAMRAAAATDEDAATAWRDRMRGFTQVCDGFVTRLQAEGSLAKGWSRSDAADFLATILSIGNWQELVEERRWSKPRYVRAMRHAVGQSLLTPIAVSKATRVPGSRS